MAKYTEMFKKDSLHYLMMLKSRGYIFIDNEKVNNVRELCYRLGISSYTLYKWKGESERINGIMEIKDNDYDEHENHSEAIESFIEGEVKDIFGIRFWGWFAKTKKIPHYSNMQLPTLKLKIGLELIKESGLIDISKILSKLKFK